MKKIAFLIVASIFQIQLLAQKGETISIDGVDIYYESYGEGEPLLLLHFFEGSHAVWNPWVDDLSKNYKLIIPDLRGHGRSTNPSGVFRHDLAASDMYALMDKLEIDSFKAMGMSSGGMTLIHMATMDTSRISSMVLIGATTLFPEQAREIMRSANYETTDPEELKSMLEIHPGGESQIKELRKQFRNMANSYDDMNFTAPFLSQIVCPTLIIHGDRDEFFPVDIPLDAYKAIPNASLWIIPNGGHLPNFQEIWKDKFLEVSILFLSNTL